MSTVLWNKGRGRAGLVARDSNGVVVGAAMELSKRAASVRVIEAAGFQLGPALIF